MTIQQLLKTAPVTTLLLISFIGLFILQVLNGVDANNPSTEALLGWGANALPLTMSDEPWRLVSSAFLHIGFMHLLFNGFAMYFFGQVAEPMFGSVKFLMLFLLAAIGGNLLNNHVTWLGILDETVQPGISAGASGGIMGIGTALLIAALFKISVNGLALNLKSLIFIMGINLVYGFAVPGIDNAGHIGGALTGLLLALPMSVAHRQQTAALQASVATYQTDYVHSSYRNDIYADNHSHIPVNSYIDTDVNTNVNTDVNTQFDTISNIPANNNSSLYNSTKSTISNVKSTIPTAVKLALIWRLLPWIMMLLITVGFIWWWQAIHNQIVQLLTVIE